MLSQFRRFVAEAPGLVGAVRDLAKAVRDLARRADLADKRLAAQEAELRAVRAEAQSTRKELRDRLLQYNLQLGRLSRSREGEAAAEPRLSWRSVPLEIERTESLPWTYLDGGVSVDPEHRQWLTLDACPLCRHPERTVVNAFNKLVLLDRKPDTSAERYDYAVCHACGIAYATRRPTGDRYRFLLEHFGEVTNKAGGGAEIDDPLLNPYKLSDADREELRQRAAKGVWVSEHEPLRKRDYLEGLIRDRFENSVHLDLLAALVAPRHARVLEIRPRAGTIGEGLRRLFNADVKALAIWESQQFLLQEVYGIECAALVDYDAFSIPYDGPFDLIVCNHMLVHSVQPDRFFDAVSRHLVPGGHLYLYNEPDDAEFLASGQSMLAHLNPLHMQTFDQRSLVRGLSARGFAPVFVKRRNMNHMCLVRRAAADFAPMTDKERRQRIRAYQRARDRAVLGVPPELRSRFADEWADVVERGVAEGLAEFDADGNLKLVARG